MPRDDDTRINPDKLLKAVESSGRGGSGAGGAENFGGERRRGHLKIFFGYAAGVGKTYAMLTAAHGARRRGIDVVVGYVEPHARPDTEALREGLEHLPLRCVEHRGIVLKEFDIDAAIKRAPQLILVDEFAHTNAPGSRHEKRYQDVEELLHAGIDVYTTVNVQHIESLNDIVAGITGVIVRERIPDSVFDGADQVELVDIEPADLLERLRAGVIYRERQAERAQENFFTVENLTALREIALRRCADRVNHLVAAARVLDNRDYHTSSHILVCVSPSPTNPHIVRSAARMAEALHAQFTALFVEGPQTEALADEDAQRLRDNMRLAEQLGATVETVYGDDVAFQIAEFARLSGVSEVVMGREGSLGGGLTALLGRKSLVDQLIAIAPNLDLRIIPNKAAEASAVRRHHRQQVRESFVSGLTGRNVLFMSALLALATIAGLVFRTVGFTDSSVISVYILTAVLTAILTTGRACTLLCSLLSVLLYDVFFVEPLHTFYAFDTSYIATFVIMFIVALAVSELTSRISENARQSAKAAYRTRVLLETNQLLQSADGEEAITRIGMMQLVKLLSREIVFYPDADGVPGEPITLSKGGSEVDPQLLTDNERATATWVLVNNKRAGATTSTLPQARCLYLAVRAGEEVFGVMGTCMDAGPLDELEKSIALSIIDECALALSRDREIRARQKAAVLAKNEQLRANLLRSISHDLRTPLTAISGSAGILRENAAMLPEETKRELLDNINNDALWLIDMMENLLTVTRIEDGSIQLARSPELVGDVLAEAVAHLSREAGGHVVRVEPADDLIARMDARLIVQVVVNLVSNALKYTPEGSHIDVRAERDGRLVRVEVADDGPGVPDAEKQRIFERFYSTGTMRSSDAHRRSFGLGLALCRSIVELHDGSIDVRDNEPHGAIFSFTLPLEEVEIHE